MLKKYIYLFALIAWLPAQTALSAGILVSPAKLDFVVSSKNLKAQELTVVNPTADVQIYDIYADDFSEYISVLPQSFTLEAGGRKIVSVSPIWGKNNSNKNISTNISVVSKPLAESKLNLATGAKIPLVISFTADKNSYPSNNYLFITAILAVAILGYYIGNRSKQNKTKNTI